MSTQTSADQTTQSSPTFDIQRIYVTDCSFESPRATDAFRQEWKPEVKLDLSTSNKLIADNVHEVVLALTATATINEQTIFLVEVKQAGLFSMKSFNSEQLGQALGSLCPSILFPYARELISSLVVRGGFPPLYLMPINFDALYAQQMRQRQATPHVTTQ